MGRTCATRIAKNFHRMGRAGFFFPWNRTPAERAGSRECLISGDLIEECNHLLIVGLAGRYACEHLADEGTGRSGRVLGHAAGDRSESIPPGLVLGGGERLGSDLVIQRVPRIVAAVEP